MKPVMILRFVAHEGPGYLGDFLDAHAIPWQLVKIDADEPLPDTPQDYSGMVLMGGPMSVNDNLPWINPVLTLILAAKSADIPLLGHCLGGQLMSKAFGAAVTKNPVKEIGWGEVSVASSPEAAHWFGVIDSFKAFHWHGETFGLPAGAVHLLSSSYCQNQAYSLGKHLAFQTHVEVTAEMVKKWCEEGEAELLAAQDSPAVQPAIVMQQDLLLHCFFLNKVAKQVYGQWIQGLQP